METKFFRVLDRFTSIPVMAIRIRGNVSQTLMAAGFRDSTYILMTNLQTLETQRASGYWKQKTMRVAHQELTKNWDQLVDESNIDCEFVREVCEETIGE